jgi:preprotein translocase SecE subunit
MFRYRPDQGIYARGIAFWVVIAYAFLAGRRFDFWVQRFGDFPNRELTGALPVLGFPLTPAFLFGVAVFASLAYLAWWLMNHPKLADLLIDTEAEMKKVTWPSFDDSKKSSYVVIGCVLFMLVFLAVTDVALQWFFQDLVF